MRPRGDITAALVGAAARGPGPVRELAARAQVGYAAACYTASRMVKRGELVVVSAARPRLLAVPQMPAGDVGRNDAGRNDVGRSHAARELHHFFFVGQASATAAGR